MKVLLGILVLCVLLTLAFAGTVTANSPVDGDEPAMMVSPNVIILAKVSTITIHTNINASTVESGSVTLDGVEPTGVGVDNCGDLVAKFAVSDLDLEPGVVTLTLSGSFTNGDTFDATETVTVK